MDITDIVENGHSMWTLPPLRQALRQLRQRPVHVIKTLEHRRQVREVVNDTFAVAVFLIDRQRASLQANASEYVLGAIGETRLRRALLRPHPPSPDAMRASFLRLQHQDICPAGSTSPCRS
jgi:hypothetical protein